MTLRIYSIISVVVLFALSSCKLYPATSAHNLIVEQNGVRVYSPNKEQISCDSTWLLFSVDYTPPHNIFVETSAGEIKQDEEWESRFVLSIDCNVEEITLNVFRMTENGIKLLVTQLELKTY